MVNDLLDYAIAETKNLLPGEEFIVKDLFVGYKWNRINRSERLLLGTLFLNHVKTFSIEIIPMSKSVSGQQKYRKA